MGPFADLPAEVLDLILAHLDRVGEHPQLYTVACAAQTLTALSQVRIVWHCSHRTSVLLCYRVPIDETSIPRCRCAEGPDYSHKGDCSA